MTLAVTTALYVLLWQIEAPFWEWAVVSLLLGLGFTFFSGATEAWLVDALDATGLQGPLESVFARGQVVTGVGMLTGSIGGGYIAQAVSLGVPFVLRGGPPGDVRRGVRADARHRLHAQARRGRPMAEMRSITSNSIEYGWRVPAVKYLMLAAPFTGGVGIYVFYALQPYLLELYGDPEAYGIAGLVAAIVAGAQILGGSRPARCRLFRRRTSALIAAEALSVPALLLIGLIESFWAVIALIVVWGLLFAAAMPDPPGLPQRPDPLPAARDDPVVRLADELDRRGGRAAGPRPSRRHARVGRPVAAARTRCSRGDGGARRATRSIRRGASGSVSATPRWWSGHRRTRPAGVHDHRGVSPLDTPAHGHENEDEVFYVLEGDHVIQVRTTSSTGPGGLAFGPRRVPHAPAPRRADRAHPDHDLAGRLRGILPQLAEAGETAGTIGPAVYARVSESTASPGSTDRSLSSAGRWFGALETPQSAASPRRAGVFSSASVPRVS